MIAAAAADGNVSGPLDRLCRTYWRPVYMFVRRSGFSPVDAQDVTQEFLVYFLERSWVKEADPARGSFRALLLTVLRNFLSNYRRRSRRLKRGGGLWIDSLDTAECERELEAMPGPELAPNLAYDRSWAQSVIAAAMQRLAEEQTRPGEPQRFETLRPFIVGTPEPGDYERIGGTLGLTRAQVAKAIHRLSRRFGELVRLEIAHTVRQPSDTEAELQQLLQALS